MTTQIYQKTEESELCNYSLLAWPGKLLVLSIGCQKAVLVRDIPAAPRSACPKCTLPPAHQIISAN